MFEGQSEVWGGGLSVSLHCNIVAYFQIDLDAYVSFSERIHARGVHTSLLMDVAVSEDGLYAFGGVLRGSVELAAVYLGDAENYLSERVASKQVNGSDVGLLDLVRVDRHSDAKLKGFGAVARLWNGWERTRAGERPEYLLFTGKGIKVSSV